MSTSSNLSMRIPSATLPTLVGIFSVVGVTAGAYNFISPLEGAKVFGLAPSPSRSTASSSALAGPLNAFERAYIRIYGIRTIGVSLWNIGLLGYWGFSEACRDSPMVANTVLRCLGIGMIAGTAVALGDAWILNKYDQEVEEDGTPEVVGKVRELAKQKSTGHAITGLVVLAVGVGCVAMA